MQEMALLHAGRCQEAKWKTGRNNNKQIQWIYVPRLIIVLAICRILTQRAYIGNGEKSCFILQQIHWAETRDVI